MSLARARSILGVSPEESQGFRGIKSDFPAWKVREIVSAGFGRFPASFQRDEYILQIIYTCRAIL